MRPRNQSARDQLRAVLARQPRASGPELAAALGVSVPTLHRMLAEQAPQVVSAGKARRARHALRRPLRGEMADLPLYEVDASGQARCIGALALLHPQGAWLDLHASAWPLPEDARDGWWDGLPYPLQDMRPQGYMGRQFAREAHQALQLPPDLRHWGDDDVAWALSRRGADLSGNLILGDAALERWLSRKLAPAPALPGTDLAELATHYARLADDALLAGSAGSSAAGEFPKFAALREPPPGGDTPHVLVKFSGAGGSVAEQRWADLLVCEHLALSQLARLPGLHAARSRVLQAQGRTLLELERFDRHGLWGRSPLCSLESLNAALLGSGEADWCALAQRLAQGGWLSPQAVAEVECLWHFGRLIGNTDMHLGNLSLRPHVGRLHLAPAYDMLPMLYAPLPGGELPRRPFEPNLPRPAQRNAWLLACGAAQRFWVEAGADERISPEFRTLARAHAQRLAELETLA